MSKSSKNSINKWVDIEILDKSKDFGLQTGYINNCHWYYSKEFGLGEVSFIDISLVDSISFKYYGAWDEGAKIYLNDVYITQIYGWWWASYVGGPVRDYNYYVGEITLNSEQIQSVIQAAKGNVIKIRTIFYESGGVGCGGGANGHIAFTFKFKSSRRTNL